MLGHHPTVLLDLTVGLAFGFPRRVHIRRLRWCRSACDLPQERRC